MGYTSSQKGHRSRLRQRFVRSGFTGFLEHEIVELFLTLCIPMKDVKVQAKALLEKFGSIRGIFDAEISELSSIKGMGNVAPIALKIIKGLWELYLQESIDPNTCILNNYERLENFWRLRLGGLKNEVFEVAFLNTQLELLKDGVVRLEEGVVDRTNVYPRKIMESALHHHASAFIIAHNHPSGSVVPSNNDCILTKRIEKAGESLEICLIDHIIISHRETFSFRKEKLIKPINSTW
ncbi:MAG: DNA repair protein RadC [Puniceicoccales bacterium]|jgi:DNA repair protein RadC|nr:DNA repair protein RadC [Puniceicoccales bacterium]